MKIIFFLTVLIWSSCKETSNKRNTNSESISSEDSLKNTLIGRWGGLGENRPVFDIKKDSIYYFKRNAAYPYKIVNNNFLIDLPETVGILNNVSVAKDTLFFYDEQGILTKGYRFK